MITVKRLSGGELLVERMELPAEPREGLMIHGYGGNKQEMLGLAATLSESTGVRLLLFDLPGHSPEEADTFTLSNAVAAVSRRLALLERPAFFIGHSVGARLGLMTGLPAGALISMPGPALFEGNRRALLETLRARRVRESSAYSGLNETLAVDVESAADTLLLYAGKDIQSATTLAREWHNDVGETKKIPGCAHLDIISHQRTSATIASWLVKA